MSEKQSNKRNILAIIIIIMLFILGGIGGFIAYQYSQANKSTGTEWGDTYYAYLKSIKEADEEKIADAGLLKDTNTAKVGFIQLKKEDTPKMVLTYQKDNENYTNIYYIGNDQKVNVITFKNPTTLKLLYNREAKEYLWYLYSKENDVYSYKSLSRIFKERLNENITSSEEAETIYADYTFKESELKSNFDVTEGEIPTISKFDKIFIEVAEFDLSEINLEWDLKELKEILIKIIEQYKTKDLIITEEIKAKTEEQETMLENKAKEIKELEEKKKQEEEAKRKAEEEAKKKAEEEAKKKAEEAAKAATVKTGKYTLADKSRDGSITIKSASANSVKFSINVVNLYGGYHLGELSGTATKSSGSKKYVYTNTEYGQTYKFYIEASGNTIKVTTSKMLNGDGFDPFCGVNAYFDGTYKK